MATFAVTRGGNERLVEVPEEQIRSLTETFAKAGLPYDPPDNVTAQASAEAWLIHFLNDIIPPFVKEIEKEARIQGEHNMTPNDF